MEVLALPFVSNTPLTLTSLYTQLLVSGPTDDFAQRVCDTLNVIADLDLNELFWGTATSGALTSTSGSSSSGNGGRRQNNAAAPSNFVQELSLTAPRGDIGSGLASRGDTGRVETTDSSASNNVRSDKKAKGKGIGGGLNPNAVAAKLAALRGGAPKSMQKVEYSDGKIRSVS